MKVIGFSAAVEAITGVVSIFDPSLVVWLLLGAGAPLAGLAVARVAGFALLSLAVVCWPRHASETDVNRIAVGLLTYNALAALFFLYLLIRGELVGPLLWPAMFVHATVAVLLVRVIAVAGRTHPVETANEVR